MVQSVETAAEINPQGDNEHAIDKKLPQELLNMEKPAPLVRRNSCLVPPSSSELLTKDESEEFAPTGKRARTFSFLCDIGKQKAHRNLFALLESEKAEKEQ